MDDQDHSIKIIRSRRRTVGLHVGVDACLTVRAPLRASQRSIEAIIAEKRVWIVAKQAMMRERQRETPAPIPPKFLRTYQKQALQIISSRVHFYAAKMDLVPARIRVNRARRRWGSCSHRGTLNFSCRLIFAPLAVIDYVVVHELAHMKELNHSRAFWHGVAAILPHFRQLHRWLKDHGHTL